MSELKIVIPSHKRHDRVMCKKLVLNPIICVEESQEEIYRRYNPDCEIVTHPDEIKGLIPKRNWMAKYFGDVFMLDDDVTVLKRLFVERGENCALRDPQQITGIIHDLYDMACVLDISLFGFGNKTTPMMYDEFSWYSLSNTITGCSYGVRNGQSEDVWWNEELKLKEDFWISCWMKYKERRILTDQRYSFTQKGTFASSGGLASIRNQAEEQRSILLMRKYFGEAIQLKGKGNNGRGETRSMVEHNITARFPY